MPNDSDLFNRWQAAQTYATTLVAKAAHCAAEAVNSTDAAR